MIRPLPLKLVLVGDSGVGKTSLLLQFVRGIPAQDNNDPDSMETLAKQVSLGAAKYSVTVVDTNGCSKHDKIRPLSYYYPPVDVFVVCYDISNPQSFNNISSKWMPETVKHCPHAKIFIVGTKLDKRDTCDANVGEVEGERLNKGLGGMGCGQVSAATGENVQEVFLQVVEIAAQKYSTTQDRR